MHREADANYTAASPTITKSYFQLIRAFALEGLALELSCNTDIAMAHVTAPSGQCLRYAPTEGRLQLPHQLTSLRSPLLVQKPAIRRQQKSALVSAVAVPLPPAQPENPARRLRRSSSEQLGKAVRLLRSLSSKFASAPEGTVQQVRAGPCRPLSVLLSVPLKRQYFSARSSQWPA